MIGKQGVSLLIGHNGVQDKTTLNPVNETVNKGVYDATLLSTVDPDLAPANIKQAVDIFGKLGTFVGGPLVEDVIGDNIIGDTTNLEVAGYYQEQNVPAGGDADLNSDTQAFATVSRAVGVAWVHGKGSAMGKIEVCLIMGGVEVATSSLLPTMTVNMVAVGTRALSGSQSCICRLHNIDTVDRTFRSYGSSSISEMGHGVAVGSIKI